MARPVDARGLEDPGAFGLLADSMMTAAMARHRVPGGVLVVVHDGGIFFARGYGYENLERKTRVDPDRTIFRAASVSKVFTATAAMQLVERKELALDVDVNRYLKRLQVVPSYREPVTLFHLLTHTAGFDERNIERKAVSAAGVESLGAYLARRLPARIAPPGRFLCYSNHGMALAGYLVEEVSGEPFDRYVRENVFVPLGMSRSTFALEPAVPADLAVGYDDSDPPRPRPVEYVKTIPASMLSTTGTDVARFMIAHLRNGRAGEGRILGEWAAEQMHRRQFAQNPLLPGIALGFWERYQNGERALWHDGDGGGFASLLYLLPEWNTGFFLVFNGRGGSAAREEVLAALLNRYFPEQRPIAPPLPMADGAREVRRCSGAYVFNRYGHRGLEKLTSLLNRVEARADSGGTLSFRGSRYVPIAPLLFRRTDGRSQLAFQSDARGRVRYTFTGDPIARVYERVPWYAASAVQLALLGFCVVVFLATLLAWPAGAVVRRFRAPRPRSDLERRAGAAAIVLGALNLSFLVGLAVFLLRFSAQLECGVPTSFMVLLTIPLLNGAIAAALVLLCVRMWQDPAASPVSRLRYSLVAVAALGFVAWLAQWNLLGYRF